MASDAIAGAWAAIEGTEFVNNTRTTAYIKAGIAPASLQVLADCSCDEATLRSIIGCDPNPYNTPALDPASWYDPLQPDSADFAGFYMTDFTGYDSTYKRDTFPIITGGAVLGRLVPQARTLKWTGFLFGKTCCSVAFGLKWLTSTLRQGRCGSECFGESLDFLWCCPEDKSPWVWCEGATAWIAPLGPKPAGYTYPAPASTTPNIGGFISNLGPFGEVDVFAQPCTFQLCDYDYSQRHIFWNVSNGYWDNPTHATPDGDCLFVAVSGPNSDPTDPPPTWMPRSVLTGVPIPVTPGDEALRTALRVGLLDGPHIKSVRKTSDCSCGCSAIMEVEFSIIAGNPYFYRSPIALANAAPLSGSCPEWIKVPPGVCPDVVPCPDPAPCTVDTRPECIPIPPPVIPQFVDPCACDPLNPVKFCTNFLAANVEAMFNGEPVFQIYSGSSPLRNATIQIYANPQGANCNTITDDPCNICTTIGIRFIPANATLTIDGTLKRITIECLGGSIQPGEPFLIGSFEWPVFECIDYCICVQVDGITVADDATYSIDVYPREM